jgi:hypothetical protein
MTSLARGNGRSGALFDLSGEIANNATWSEDIYFSESGAPSLLTGLSFKMTFRCRDDDTAAYLTLSTDTGALSIQNDDDGYARILRISVTAGDLASYRGDYIADLASKDVANSVTLWANGIVTFTPNPVSF